MGKVVCGPSRLRGTTMKPIHTSLAALALVAGLSACRPDQEYRLAEACRESVTYIVAPRGDGMEKACSCLAKAAVAQLTSSEIEYMIRMYDGDQTLLASGGGEGMESLAKIIEFEAGNQRCLNLL